MKPLNQSWRRAANPRPIVIIGAGSIVRTAHLPIYQRLEYPVAGLFDISADVARRTASEFDIRTIFSSLDEACRRTGVVFDLAVPGDQILGIVERLPERSAVLIQKPLGQDLSAARDIRTVCHQRALTACVNFQLRFSPNVLALRDMLSRSLLGTMVDIEVRLVVNQPWHLWTFLKSSPRVEILYHSIHYLDVIRSLLGEPSGVYCRAVGHPELREFRDTRSTIILDYGDCVRCSLTLNHTHRQGPPHRASQLKVETTSGAAVLTFGVNLDYPHGGADALEVAIGDGSWEQIPLRGSWFIEAFEGPMSNLQRFVAGEDDALLSSVDDAIKTMALVEACYESSERGATMIPSVD
ncbi:MAG: Gfo/Idh/MocA family protein [Acidimicrobiia bacterium]